MFQKSKKALWFSNSYKPHGGDYDPNLRTKESQDSLRVNYMSMIQYNIFFLFQSNRSPDQVYQKKKNSKDACVMDQS